MSYFVTGATGFIGRFLVQSLLQRGRSTVYVLVRPKSMGKLDELYEAWGKDSRRRVAQAMDHLGLKSVGKVRVGRSIEIELPEGASEEKLHELCRDLLSNPVIEDYELQIS